MGAARRHRGAVCVGLIVSSVVVAGTLSRRTPEEGQSCQEASLVPAFVTALSQKARSVLLRKKTVTRQIAAGASIFEAGVGSDSNSLTSCRAGGTMSELHGVQHGARAPAHPHREVIQ